MISPAATLNARTDTPTRHAQPLVLIDGRPTAALSVQSLTMQAPLDRRTARLVMERRGHGLQVGERARIAPWIGRSVSLLKPIELTGGEARLLPLFTGNITGVDQKTSGRDDALMLHTDSDWDRLLDETWDRDALLESGQTLADWLAAINRHDGIALDTALLLAGQLDRTISNASGHRTTIGRVLTALCREFGLTVDTRLNWDGRRVTFRPTLRSEWTARPVRISSLLDTDQADRLESLAVEHPMHRPIQWIARANGQVVESTFLLLAGWDPNGEGQPDATYQKSTNPDFEQVANVYRLWVLNEDGALGDPPYDLTGLFDDGRAIDPQPLRFGNTLTQSAEGRTLGFVVDISTDGGTNWSQYPGQAVRLIDRAGVYLNDDALPATFLAAAKADLARVRITATLQNPLPIEQVRWTGNPFAGDFEQRVIEFGDRFVYRRVDASSRYHQAVSNDTLTADEPDHRTDMQRELVRRAAASQPTDETATTTAFGPQIGLRLGDRLADLVGCDVGTALSPSSVARSRVHLQRIEHRWTDGRSQLTWGS